MIAHFRPLLFAFLALALGLYIGKLFFYSSAVYLYVFVGIFALSFIGVFLYFAFKKSKFFQWFWHSRYRILTVFLCFGIGFGLFNISYYNMDSNFESNRYAEYYVVGKVDNSYSISEDTMHFYLADVTVTQGDNTFYPQHRFVVYVDLANVQNTSEIFEISPGDTVLFRGNVYERPVFSSDYMNTYAYKNNYRHAVYADASDIVVSKGQMGVLDSVRESIRDLLNANMETDMANLAYSVLTGDDSDVSSEIMKDFQRSGIAHIIAVSGLNVAFIAILLMWPMRLMRIKERWQIPIVCIVLIFYCALCGFAVSVVRATLMYILLMIGRCFGKQTDGLSSVSLAGLILLLLQPLMLFDLSFLLSFASVFAIILLMPVFQSLYKKCRFKSALDVVSMTIAAQIGTLPFLVNAFDQISIVGIVANVILVPFFGYVYMALFLIVFLSLIIPFLQYILWLIQWGLYVVSWGSGVLSDLSFAVAQFPHFYDVITIVVMVGIFVASYSCLFSRKLKLYILGILSAVTIAGISFSAVDSLTQQINFTRNYFCAKIT